MYEPTYRTLLELVMTTAEAEQEFGLQRGTALKAAQQGRISARKSAGTWLILRGHAEHLWGGKHKAEK